MAPADDFFGGSAAPPVTKPTPPFVDTRSGPCSAKPGEDGVPGAALVRGPEPLIAACPKASPRDTAKSASESSLAEEKRAVGSRAQALANH